jgi:hypothetical protein
VYVQASNWPQYSRCTRDTAAGPPEPGSLHCCVAVPVARSPAASAVATERPLPLPCRPEAPRRPPAACGSDLHMPNQDNNNMKLSDCVPCLRMQLGCVYGWGFTAMGARFTHVNEESEKKSRGLSPALPWGDYRKPRKHVRITGVTAEIRTEHLQIGTIS